MPMSSMSYLIIIPKWSTFFLLVFIILQLILAWRGARKTGKKPRSALLPNILASAAMAIVFVREWFGNIPVWIEAPLVVICLLLILIAFVLWGIWLKRYLRDAWRLEEHNNK